jgi:hypothetical protein
MSIFAVSAFAQSKQEFSPQLKQIFDKARTLKFSGVRVVTIVKAGKAESHEEFVTKDGDNMRIEFSDSSAFKGQIIVESKDGRRHYFPDKNEIHILPAFGKKQFEVFGRMASRGRKMRTSVSDGEVVAGVRTQKATLFDGSDNRIAELNFDSNTGMILRRVLYSLTGSVAGSFEFKTVDMNPKISKGAFQINRKGAKIVSPLDMARVISTKLNLPLMVLVSDRYQLESVNSRRMKGSDVMIQTYTGRDVRLTLFAFRGDRPDFKPKGRNGELSTYAWQLNGVNLLLVGDESESKLREIANKITNRTP